MMRAHWRVLLILTLIPILANAGILSGAFNCDPETFFIGLGFGEKRLLSGSACFVDPGVAYLTEALGYLSAQDWLHGIIPWWNPYTGVGLPLAAEVQNESFFLPFVLLLHFHSGWFIQRLLFQILSGLFTYAFLTGLRVEAAGAILGAALFSLNGTFTLTAGTVTAPIFFLPLLLIGIEQANAAAITQRRMGWSLIPLAVAGGIYAGFPETAYFNDLFAGFWTILRLLQTKGSARWHFLVKTSLGAAIGVALTTPMVVPFLQYLHIANTGPHEGYFALATLPAAAAPLQMLPMFYGGISQFPPASLYQAFQDMWVRIGGWFGCAPVLLALYALMPRAEVTPRHRGERYLLAGWTLLWEARSFGVPGIIPLVNLIPGIASSDAIRYAPLSVEFAVFALAAFGFEDLRRQRLATRHGLRWALIAFIICLGLSIIPALRYLPTWFQYHPHLRVTAAVNLVCVGATLAVLIHSLRTGRHLLATQSLIIAGGILVFLIPQLGGLRAVHVDGGGIDYLQKNAGRSRYFSIGPLAANFPAQFGIAGINSLQVPSPNRWDDFYSTRLLLPSQNIDFGASPATEVAAVLANMPAFEALGVKYMGIWPAMDPIATTLGTAPGPLILKPPTGPGVGRFTQLLAGQSLSGSIAKLPWASKSIYAVTVVLGTFDNRTNGPLEVKLCMAAECASGQADLSMAADNAAFTIPLDHPLRVQQGARLTYRFTHPAGAAIAFWLASDLGESQHLIVAGGAESPGVVPMLGFQQSAPSNQPMLVFHSITTNLYQFPNPAPYAQTSERDCNLVTYTRKLMKTDCPQPATLTRRELFYPGWRARVNGTEAAIRPTDKIFQQIDLPAGPAVIRFSYLPPYTYLSCAVALLAALLWLACALFARRQD